MTLQAMPMAASIGAALLTLTTLGGGQGIAQPAAKNTSSATDTIRLTAGGTRTGILTGCVGNVCQMDGAASIPRREIAAIGFGGVPPSAPAGEQDLVVFRQGPPRILAVYGVSTIDVVTAAGPLDRPTVAGIVFARLPPPTGSGAGGVATGSTGASPAPPAPGTSSQPSGAASPAGGPPPPPIDRLRVRPDGTIENGALWTGMVRGVHYTYGSYPNPFRHAYRVVIQVRLREVSAWKPSANTYEITLRNEGTTITSFVNLGSGCGDQRTIKFSDQNNLSDSTIRYAIKGTDRTAGYDVTPDGVAMFEFSPEAEWTACEGTPLATEGLAYGLSNNHLSMGGGTGTWDLDNQRRPLIENRSRFRGSMSYRLLQQTNTSEWQVRWDICRQGNNNCTPLPEFEPCARSGQDQALADRCTSELQLRAAAVETFQAEFDQLWSAAEEHMAGYVRAIAECKVYDEVKKWLERIATANASELGETGAAVQYLKTVLQATASGNLKDFLMPDNVKKVLGAMNDISDFATMFSSSAVSVMTSQLNSCSGKARVDDILDGRKFLENVSAAMDLYRREIAPRLNDIRSKMLECEYLQYKASLAGDPACFP